MNSSANVHQQSVVHEVVQIFNNRTTLLSLTKRQFVVTHTIRQTKIPALLDSCVTNTSSVMCPQKNNCLSLYFCKNITCLSVGLLRIGQVFVSVKLLFHERYQLLFLESITINKHRDFEGNAGFGILFTTWACSRPPCKWISEVQWGTLHIHFDACRNNAATF